MKLLKEKILKEGLVLNNDVLKVDSFINHQIDTALIRALAKEIAANFKADRILTIETSGLPIAFAVAEEMGNLPLTFAKKSESAITGTHTYITEVNSFTRCISSVVTVDKKYIQEGERVLIVDDFLAAGNASLGLVDLCKQAGAKVAGVAVAIEKGFQGGRKKLEGLGITVFSGANIKAFVDNKPVFQDEKLF
ncbi:MAG: xanthine phosphoribosyltransferase [Erysipelotrichia bacterium]|nr:xanthine phosphoribosyltransferase [Erysipelotrichia bacterium]